MSQSTRSAGTGQAKRALWLRYALSIHCGAMLGFNAVGCASVGRLQPLAAGAAASPAAQQGAPIVNAASRTPANVARSASLSAAKATGQAHTGLAQADIPQSPSADVMLVAHEEPLDATGAAYNASAGAPLSHAPAGPLATLAACQVSGSCAPVGGNSSCGCGGASCGVCAATGTPGMNVQEYIFDGGDQDPAVLIRRDWSVAGLNPTDTVAHYETYDGKLCVTPTNRVPIYAPRFAAVRKITGAVISDSAVATQRILAPVTPGRFEDTNPPTTVMQPVAALGEERVSLIDAFRDRNLGVPIAQVLPPQRMSDAVVPFEYYDSFGTGLLQAKEIAVIGQFLQNARTWVTPESLQVLIDDQQVSQQLDVKQAQDIHVYDLPPGKCSLRICKAASHMLANSGDTISFTIRFDNAGSQPIRKVVILDSLSPRLEYIEGSQQNSIAPPPKFSTEPNEVGSTVLRWELEPALQPGEGGTIHFRCLVR